MDASVAPYDRIDAWLDGEVVALVNDDGEVLALVSRRMMGE